jgi:hypothetical protein
MWRKALIAIATLTVVATGLWLWRFMAIDSCLDDGGGWSETSNKCECSRRQLAEPNVSKEYVAFCETPGPVP